MGILEVPPISDYGNAGEVVILLRRRATLRDGVNGMRGFSYAA